MAPRGEAFRIGKRRLVRAEGIEPSSQAWEARILPMNYARVSWEERANRGARSQAVKPGGAGASRAFSERGSSY